jgi:uncharacterized membrane protein YeaQ/YmgE (transglycosylase-associated protein family)
MRFNPLKWKYEDQVGLLVATLAGAVLGIITGGALEHGWFNMLIWALIGAVVLGGWVYWHRAFR